MEKDSTLQYKTSYDKRVKAYESQSMKPEEKQEGLMGRRMERGEEIRDNNRTLMDSVRTKKDN